MTSNASDGINVVGVLGARSMVGGYALAQLSNSTQKTIAFSRNTTIPLNQKINWRQLPSAPEPAGNSGDLIPLWICLAPIWALPDYFSILEVYGVRRVIVLSSTSRFTKSTSTDVHEQEVARRLIEAENCLRTWAKSRNVEWVVLRPTLIYAPGQDRNISEIARFIRRFRFFPVFGAANGKRQPIHARDVAKACVAALYSPNAVNHAYNISGGEIISYRDMVGRIFTMLDAKPRLLTVPLWAFRAAIALLRKLPRYRAWSSSMAERMNQDMVFDHSEATHDFGFMPRKFVLEIADATELRTAKP